MEIQISPKKVIDITITPRNPEVGIDVPSSTKERVDVDVGAPHSGVEYPIYHGPTSVKPEAYEMQILETEDTTVKENIVVLPIPYFQTSNPQGGNTVYIGD